MSDPVTDAERGVQSARDITEAAAGGPSADAVMIAAAILLGLAEVTNLLDSIDTSLRLQADR